METNFKKPTVGISYKSADNDYRVTVQSVDIAGTVRFTNGDWIVGDLFAAVYTPVFVYVVKFDVTDTCCFSFTEERQFEVSHPDYRHAGAKYAMADFCGEPHSAYGNLTKVITTVLKLTDVTESVDGPANCWPTRQALTSPHCAPDCPACAGKPMSSHEALDRFIDS